MSLLALAYWQETGIKLGLALAVIPTTSLVLVYLFLFQNDGIHAESPWT